ncbi:MAG TPA: glutathione S-transferase family protein [Burkholderiales bacterium]|nr:glutathione S-transferase family protein [Burkholderiales bacterium]
MLLVIGNKNYSSWSLRPWIAMKRLGIAFDEVRIALDQPDTQERIRRYNPAGKVPCLVDGDLTVWDSLAILEYLAEREPRLWPADPALRARARSVAAEMHAGFAALRTHMPMNVRHRFPGKGRNAEVDADLARVQAIWDSAKGPFLFGTFCAADAMFAPVVLRFRSYEPPLSAASRAYVDAMLALPAMQEWIAGAHVEAEALPKYDTLYA